MNDALPGISPFLLDHDEAYRRWRDEKLNDYPETLAALVVEIADPFSLTRGEKERILTLCAKSNMALFCVPTTQGSAQLLPAVMAQLGVRDLDHNLGAGSDGLSMLSPGGSAYSRFSEYVPYRETPIGWHTDGYYHPRDHQIRGLSLYCERPAQQGCQQGVDRVQFRFRRRTGLLHRRHLLAQHPCDPLLFSKGR